MNLTLEKISGFNKLDRIIAMQDIEDLPRVLSCGFISEVNKTNMFVYVESDNFCSTMPVYIVKTDIMLKVDTPEERQFLIMIQY